MVAQNVSKTEGASCFDIFNRGTLDLIAKRKVLHLSEVSINRNGQILAILPNFHLLEVLIVGFIRHNYSLSMLHSLSVVSNL
jgi:hypothetical protein